MSVEPNTTNKSDRFKTVFEVLRDFISFTSLHGIPNIRHDFQSLKELSSSHQLSKRYVNVARYMSVTVWGASFLIGIFLSFTLINIQWQRSVATPTLTTIDTYYHPIWKVPFPAVTICNLNKVYAPAAEVVIANLVNKGYNETLLRRVFPHLDVYVRPRQMNLDSEELLRFRAVMLANKYKIRNLMKELMQPCENLLISCIWLNEEIPCQKLFHISDTTEGLCCSFNHRSNNAHEYRSGYHVTGTGDYVGLSVNIMPEMSAYVAYTRDLYGVQVGIHPSDEFANLDNLVIAQPGYDAKIMITPSVLVADPNVRYLKVSQRKCLFEEEGTSDVDYKFSYASCMTDCKVRNIAKLCGCIPFYYPHVWLDKYSKTPHCSFRYVECMRNVRAKISSLLPPKNAIGFEYAENHSDIGLKCDECLPDCHHVRYNYQTILSDRRRAKPDLYPTAKERRFRMKYGYLNYTSIFVGFKEPTCVRYRRSVFISWEDLFASVGGVFGLCLGASTISIIEVIYFILIRVCGRILLTFVSSKTSQNSINTRARSFALKRINTRYETNIYKFRKSNKSISVYYD